MHWLDYSMIAVYMAAILGIGFYFSRNEKDSSDFLLGGRSMPYFAIGLSCMMSLLSSVSIVVTPSEIFNHGLTLFSLSSTLGLFLAIPCYLLFIRFYFKLGSFTPYEYLEYRYNKSIRALIAVSSLYTRILYLGMVLYTTSKIFEGAYGWSAWVTILAVGIIGMAYTVMGGMKAVVWTDVMQFFVLCGGFVVVIVVLCLKIDGGAWKAVTYAFEHGHGAPQYATVDFYKISPYIRLSFWILLYNAIIAPLTTACSDQILIQRFLSTKNWKEGFKSQIVATCSAFPFILVLWFVGLALFTFYRQNPDMNISDADGVFFHFIADNLPSPMPGLFMAAMLAAIMSTLDSGMNSMATVWLKEIHQKYINKKMDSAREVKVSRWATLLVGVIAVILGLLLNSSSKWLAQSAVEVGMIFTLIGTIILPVFLIAVLSSRANAVLVWLLMAYSIGDCGATKLWYVLSRSAKQAWRPGQPLSWAGALDFGYVLLPLLISVVAFVIWYLIRRQRKKILSRVLLLLAALASGVTLRLLVWAVYSNCLITDKPMALSFVFDLPLTLVVGFIALWFWPKQPREKYQGLTLGTINEPIIMKVDSNK
jgi:SSS family solute:Na+ symporter